MIIQGRSFPLLTVFVCITVYLKSCHGVIHKGICTGVLSRIRRQLVLAIGESFEVIKKTYAGVQTVDD